MSAKECAIIDIQEELSKDNKIFIAFRKELDPIMQSIVQQEITKRNKKKRKHQYLPQGELCATCFFVNSTVTYRNYEKGI